MKKKCSNCLHSAAKVMYINTVPSIHTCMNKESKTYLVDKVWSDVCDLWKKAPERYDAFTQIVVDTDNLLKSTITIKQEEYEYLKERDLKLTSLERAGVDNWDAYDYSIDILEELKEIKNEYK